MTLSHNGAHRKRTLRVHDLPSSGRRDPAGAHRGNAFSNTTVATSPRSAAGFHGGYRGRTTTVRTSGQRLRFRLALTVVIPPPKPRWRPARGPQLVLTVVVRDE